MPSEQNNKRDDETSRSSEEVSSPSGPSESPSLPQSIDDAINSNDENIETDQLATDDQTSLTVENEISSSSTTAVDPKPHNKKQLHAKQLIERYFHQLTVGCGFLDCKNENCASNKELKALTPNQAAARAIKLFSEEAAFCEDISHETKTKSKLPATGATSQINEVDDKSSDKMYRRAPVAELPYMDELSMNQLIDYCKKNNTFAPLIRNLGRYFSSREYLVKSFQKQAIHAQNISQFSPKFTPHTHSKHLNKEEYRSLEGDLDRDKDDTETLYDDRSTTTNYTHKNAKYQKHYTSVDLESLRRAMKNLLETKASAFDSLNNALQSLALSLSVELRILTQRDKIEEIITVFVIIFEIIIIGKSDFVDVALPTILKAASYLPIWAQARLAHIWAYHCKDGLRKLLETLQQLISLQVITGTYHEDSFIQDNEHIINATKLMKIVYYANILAGPLEPHVREEDNESDSHPQDDSMFIYSNMKKSSPIDFADPLAKELQVNVLDCRHPFIPFEEFYNEPLSDAIEMDNDYLYYKNRQDNRFSFMLNSFILMPATKTLGLYYDCRIRMYNERRLNNFHTQLAGQPSNPYLKVRVRRDHIIDDALVELEIIALGNPTDLKKQLVVEFVGEEGVDEGGVSKEFFQMVVEEIFNPDYGMFIQHETTQSVWFNSSSFENEAQFTLIGIILGLAIYNNIILAVNFPMVVYRKLMGIKGTFTDLAEYDPTVYRSLKNILDYEDDDIEEVFMQTFQISYQDVFGHVHVHNLEKDGDRIFVNHTNKKEFVDLYADYLLNTSIDKKFRAFRRGFQMVTDESPLPLLFRPEEIELLVCGSKEFDFIELEKSTSYANGYTEKSPTIKYFWEIVHSLPLESKKKLLEFTTGSDRVPIGGMSRFKLVIARNGSSDSDRLPTSHTCYNVLLLPDYESKEKLEERLLKAITYSKGFGMI